MHDEVILELFSCECEALKHQIFYWFLECLAYFYRVCSLNAAPQRGLYMHSPKNGPQNDNIALTLPQIDNGMSETSARNKNKLGHHLEAFLLPRLREVAIGSGWGHAVSGRQS